MQLPQPSWSLKRAAISSCLEPARQALCASERALGGGEIVEPDA
jgi:hypothetical protein